MACTDCIHLDNGCQWCGHCFGSVSFILTWRRELYPQFASIFTFLLHFFEIEFLPHKMHCVHFYGMLRVHRNDTSAHTSIPHTHATAQRWRQRRISVCRLVLRHTRVVFKGDDYGSVLSGQRSMAPLFFFLRKARGQTCFVFVWFCAESAKATMLLLFHGAS